MRCKGFVRHGGIFTLGMAEWKQCEANATVMIKFKQNDEEINTLPSCNECWQRIINSDFIKIISTEPMKEAPDENTP